MKHIFLTGRVQVGKTTVINKVINQPGLRVGGFRTAFGPDRFEPGRKLIYMYDAGGPPTLDREHAIAYTAGYNGGDPFPKPYTERFDTLGVRYLQEARERGVDLILCDECGYLESEALDFQYAVMEAISGDIPVLGVIRMGYHGWLNAIANHHRVEVIEVTEGNRDDLPDIINRKLFMK